MRYLLAVGIAALAGCAVPDLAPDVPPEATFRNQSVADVQQRLAAICAKGHLLITSQTQNVLSCEGHREIPFMTGFLLGTDPSADGTAIIQFTTIAQGNDVRVTWTMEERYPLRNGNTKVTSIDSNKLNAQMRDGLMDNGASN